MITFIFRKQQKHFYQGVLCIHKHIYWCVVLRDILPRAHWVNRGTNTAKKAIICNDIPFRFLWAPQKNHLHPQSFVWYFLSFQIGFMLVFLDALVSLSLVESWGIEGIHLLLLTWHRVILSSFRKWPAHCCLSVGVYTWTLKWCVRANKQVCLCMSGLESLES